MRVTNSPKESVVKATATKPKKSSHELFEWEKMSHIKDLTTFTKNRVSEVRVGQRRSWTSCTSLTKSVLNPTGRQTLARRAMNCFPMKVTKVVGQD